MDVSNLRHRLFSGLVIPAHPLALRADGTYDEAAQRKLTRYYRDSGAGGIAVAVHTTQFAIREHKLLEPVLRAGAEEAGPLLRIAGVCGRLEQATREAELAASLGYDAVLASLSAYRADTEDAMLAHLGSLAQILPVFGFYLQPAVGGRLLPHSFWRRACEIENLVAIKVAPFNRYQTLDVVRAVALSGRENEIALYTGNDDAIVADLVTPLDLEGKRLRFSGGLLGQWAVGTKSAVSLLARCRIEGPTPGLLALGAQLTDLNAALFDAENSFRGCIAGIHEVLVRQGRLPSRRCLDPHEDLSPGQAAAIDRVMRAYPHLLE